jgi:hypothetical protein
MYLTARAMYIIAFDLHAYEDETFETRILLFIQSLQMRVGSEARLMLVGTHADLLNGSTAIETKCRQVAQRLEQWDTQERAILHRHIHELDKGIEAMTTHEKATTQTSMAVVHEKLERLRFERKRLRTCLHNRMKIPKTVYPVSSSESLYGLKELRHAIGTLVLDKSLFPHVGEQIPLVSVVFACFCLLPFCLLSV